MTPQQAASALNKFRQELPYLVGTEIVNFILDNWDKQGFQGGSFQKWEPRKGNSRSGGAILVGKQSGRLRRSQKFRVLPGSKVEGGSDLDYAAIHNKGGRLKVKVTEKSRRFFWAMHYKTGDEMWKWMALTKKTYMTITIPKRQFIGPSPVLDRMIEQMIEKRLKRILG